MEIVNTSYPGLGVFSSWGGSAISAFGNIGGSLIGGIYGNKIARINSGVANFNAQTQADISQDNLAVAKMQEDTKRLQQAANIEINKMLAKNNQLDAELKDEQNKAKNKTTQYAILGGAAIIVTLGVVFVATR